MALTFNYKVEKLKWFTTGDGRVIPQYLVLFLNREGISAPITKVVSLSFYERKANQDENTAYAVYKAQFENRNDFNLFLNAYVCHAQLSWITPVPKELEDNQPLSEQPYRTELCRKVFEEPITIQPYQTIEFYVRFVF